MGLRLTKEWAKKEWAKHSQAGVGLLLEPSELVVVDLDGDEAYLEAKRRGLADTLVVETGKGRHFYYRRPSDYPVGRATQRGDCKLIDILSAGYVVAPPSKHRLGRSYLWGNKSKDFELPEPPWWTRAFFPKRLKSWQKPSYYTPKFGSRVYAEGSAYPEEVRAALSYLTEEVDDYDFWLRVGFALKSWDDFGNGGGKGFELWDEWSRAGNKYPGTKELRYKWDSFQKGKGVSLGSLFRFAKEHGWQFAKPEGMSLKDGPKVGFTKRWQ
jgi:hypothetical protein